MTAQDTKQRIISLLNRLHEAFGQEGNLSEDLLWWYERHIDDILIQPKYTPLLPTEKAVVTLGDCWKTAALCFDRVWAAPVAEVGFSGLTDHELVYLIEKSARRLLAKDTSDLNITPEFKAVLRDAENHLDLIRKVTLMLAVYPDAKMTAEEIISHAIHQVHPRWLSTQLTQHFHRPVLPIFTTNEDRARAYQEGEDRVVITILKNLNVVSERDLSWDQVMEFRRDSESRSKYRRLLHWLDSEMIGKSLAFVEDEVALRLEDYTYALRKHGITTIKGALSSVLDWKSLVAGAASVSAIASQEILGAAAAGSVIVGKVVIEIIDAKLKLDRVKRGKNSEVAFVHEVKKLR